MTKIQRSAIVIASHKVYPRMRECVAGFLDLVEDPGGIFLVDNGSQGEVSNWAQQHFPKISLIVLPNNLLFCGGYNTGIRASIAEGFEFALIVNADCVVVNTDFVGSLEKAMDENASLAFVGPRVWETESGVVQTTRLRFPNLVGSLLVWLPYRLNRKWFATQDETEGTVEFLNGVCVLCRLKALDEIGLMDETFGGYVEDADWSWRARRLGWMSGYVPVDSVLHEQEKFGYDHRSFKVFLLKRNTVYFYLKSGMPFSAVGYSLMSILLAAIRFLLSVFSGQMGRSWFFLRALSVEYMNIFFSWLRNGRNSFSVELPTGLDRLRT